MKNEAIRHLESLRNINNTAKAAIKNNSIPVVAELDNIVEIKEYLRDNDDAELKIEYCIYRALNFINKVHFAEEISIQNYERWYFNDAEFIKQQIENIESKHPEKYNEAKLIFDYFATYNNIAYVMANASKNAIKYHLKTIHSNEPSIIRDIDNKMHDKIFGLLYYIEHIYGRNQDLNNKIKNIASQFTFYYYSTACHFMGRIEYYAQALGSDVFLTPENYLPKIQKAIEKEIKDFGIEITDLDPTQYKKIEEKQIKKFSTLVIHRANRMIEGKEPINAYTINMANYLLEHVLTRRDNNGNISLTKVNDNMFKKKLLKEEDKNIKTVITVETIQAINEINKAYSKRKSELLLEETPPRLRPVLEQVIEQKVDKKNKRYQTALIIGAITFASVSFYITGVPLLSAYLCQTHRLAESLSPTETKLCSMILNNWEKILISGLTISLIAAIITTIAIAASAENAASNLGR